MMGRFNRWFPGWYYRPGRWPTRDGVIPFKTLLGLMTVIPHLEAGEELMLSNAVALGYSNARAGKKNSKVRNYLRALRRRAFPEIVDYGEDQ